MTRFLVLLSVVATAWAPVAYGDDEFNPYEIPQAQFAARVKTIALREPLVPFDVADRALVRERITARVTEVLRGKGYTVISPDVYAALWRQMSERLGGTFDPITGAVREDAYNAARDHVGRELARLHQVDAVLGTFIGVDWLPFGTDLVGYASLGEPLNWQGQRINTNLINRPQQVRGYTLSLVIDDLAGTKLYGIRFPIEWSVLYVARGYEERPQAERLTNPVSLQHAIDEDLEQLVPVGQERTP